ncbi:MAG TPA: VOC family protein [Candidatus Bathyarchaeia archaeon]
MAGLRKIDSIMMRVTDLDSSARFYEEVMGLKRAWTDKVNQMVGFLFPGNNSELVIHTNSTLSSPSYSFSVDDVVEFCERFREQGYAVLMEPFEVRCGMYAVLADPDGNRINIIDLKKFGGEPRYDV